MATFRMRQPWTPWWLAVPLGAGYLGFGYLLLRSAQEAWQYERLLIPAYVLLGWWAIPAAVNARVITAGPEGVRAANGPIPKGRTVWAARRDIRCCTVRTQYALFRSRASGEMARVANYTAGVETWEGKQLDIAYPYLDHREAAEAAARLAEALNQNRALARIPVQEARYAPHEEGNWRRRVLAWTGAFLGAILAGAAWELAR